MGMKPLVLATFPSQIERVRIVGRAVDGDVRDRVGEGVDLREIVRAAFQEGRPLVLFLAVGAAVRLLADLLGDKESEPPVVCVSSDGKHVVPVLGGHHGANDLAALCAAALGAVAAVTTASGDSGAALENLPVGWKLDPLVDRKSVLAQLAQGSEIVCNDGSVPWLEPGSGVEAVGSERAAADASVVLRPANLVVGVGCERGCGIEELVSLVRSALDDAGLSPSSIAAVVSIDLKSDETAVLETAADLHVPARFLSAEILEAERDRLANPSEIVFAEVGCHGVAEGGALAGAGPAGELIVAKRKSKRATVAIARAPEPVDPKTIGRARGSLHVVGLGPGTPAWRAPEAAAVLGQCDHWVGYSLYLDLAADLHDGQVRHEFPLGGEEDRVRHALELAGRGEEVALICSGDPGIYAMASLVFEVLERGDVSDGSRRAKVSVVPGISALQAAAARAGAPLGHDFCTISLSDLLTPWEAIERRIQAAADGDFVIAFYNPVSKRRRTQLAHAVEILLEHRPADTPVIIATDLGRPNEAVRIARLDELRVDDVDMLTVVLVGSSHTRAFEDGEGRMRVFTPRGYSAKPGTTLAEAAE